MEQKKAGTLHPGRRGWRLVSPAAASPACTLLTGGPPLPTSSPELTLTGLAPMPAPCLPFSENTAQCLEKHYPSYASFHPRRIFFLVFLSRNCVGGETVLRALRREGHLYTAGDGPWGWRVSVFPHWDLSQLTSQPRSPPLPPLPCAPRMPALPVPQGDSKDNMR